MAMAAGSGAFGLSIRQITDLVDSQDPTCTLNAPSDVQRQCTSTDFTCLCAQAEPNTFVDWFLSTVCNTCDGSQGLQVDPVSELASYCPVQAAATAGSFKCAFYTTPVPASTMASSTTLPLETQGSASPTTEPTSVTSNTLLGPQPTSTSQTILATATLPTSPISSSQIISPNSRASSSSQTSSLATGLTLTSQNPTLLSATSSGSISSPSSGPTLTETSSGSKSGLSTGAKAGIGVAAALLPILLALLLFFFCYRRRKSRNQEWQPKSREIIPELYSEDNGNLAAYSAANHENIYPTQEKSFGAGQGSGIREVFVDSSEVSPVENVRRSRIGLAMSPEPGNYPDDRSSRIGLAMSPEPGNRGSMQSGPGPSITTKRFSVPRKEVATSYVTPVTPVTPVQQQQQPSYDAYSSRESRVVRDSVVASSPVGRDSLPRSGLGRDSAAGRDSQMSGILTGPMQDMYVYGGETFETDEELARLEEEERRIDEAIQETERLAHMRMEREAVRARILEVRKSVTGLK